MLDRTGALAEIDASFAWDGSWTGTTDDLSYPSSDILALQVLLKLDEGVLVGLMGRIRCMVPFPA